MAFDSIDIGSVLLPLLSALWVMIPAYVPNPIAAVLGGGTPIDRGAVFSDGRRVFGDGKTYRGFIGGILAGILVGVFLIWLREAAGLLFFPEMTLLSVGLFAAGALLGDLVKSFFKRRLGKDRGEKWPIADMYDLVAGALALTLIFDPGWLFATVTPLMLFWIIVATPVLHRTVNIIGYITGVKDVPW